MTSPLRYSLIGLLALAYLATLVMSAGHLTKWFDLTLGDLPWYFSIGLAVGLELLAFTLSLASTLEPRLRWSLGGGMFFLLLVWLGNLLAMGRVAEAGLLEVFAQSLFALGPLVAGKAIGELLRLTPPVSSPLSAEPAPPIPTTLETPFTLGGQVEVTTNQSLTTQTTIIHALTLTPDLEAILTYLRGRGGVQARELVGEVTGVSSEETARRKLRKLRDLGVAAYDGKAWKEVNHEQP